MKLKYFMVLVVILATAGTIYSIHSQTTPTPLRSFVATSVMSAPVNGLDYPITSVFSSAVRADGSWVEIWTRNIKGQNHYERDIHDFEKGVYTIVEDATRSVVRKNIPKTEYHNRLAAAVSCHGFPDGEILGLAVNYVTENYQITENPQGDATAIVKTWVVPNLGCFVIKKETTWTRDSDGVVLTDTTITPITVSFQPVDQFFEVPAFYTERTQQETLDLLNQSLNKN